MRAVVGLELIFCKDYNLLIYLKIVIAKRSSKAVKEDTKELESELSNNKSSEDKLLDIDNDDK